MNSLKAFQSLVGKVHEAIEAESDRLFADRRLHIETMDKLHGNEAALAVNVSIICRDNVRVADTGSSLELVEIFFFVVASRNLLESLQSNLATEAGVIGKVNNGSAAFADFFLVGVARFI